MRKAINFDINTIKYEKLTNKKSPNAYLEIKEYFKNHGFEHRQGSGYVSIGDITSGEISAFIRKMSDELDWLKYCVHKFDVTNIGNQYSLINQIKYSFDIIDLLFTNEDNNIKVERQKENIYKYIKESALELEETFKYTVLNIY